METIEGKYLLLFNGVVSLDRNRVNGNMHTGVICASGVGMNVFVAFS